MPNDKTRRQTEPEPRMTYGEAAQELGVTTTTVCRYAKRGLLERVKVTRRNVFVTERSVRNLLRVRQAQE